MADEDNATLTIYLLGGNEIKQGLPLEEAQRVQQAIMLSLEAPEVKGSFTLPNGTLIRNAAVAASRITVARSGRSAVLR